MPGLPAAALIAAATPSKVLLVVSTVTEKVVGPRLNCRVPVPIVALPSAPKWPDRSCCALASCVTPML